MALSIVPPTTPVSDGWRSLLRYRDKELAQVPYNARVLFQNHEDYKGFIRWNKVTMRVEISGGALAACANKEDIDDVVTWAQDHLVYKHELNVGREELGRRLVAVAMENQYDPLQEYLMSLVWDGIPRLNAWLMMYGGAKDTGDGYLSFVGRKWMLSTVARAFQPGCKADVVLVIEGDQGQHKSTLLRILGDLWYCEAAGALGDKDSKQLINAKWICELPDMASFNNTDRNSMKAFFSSMVDRYRPPYGKGVIEIPRRAVFAATTNDEDYLTDPTGNRRFWPVMLGELRDIDRALLIRDKDQLFAEAVALYLARENCPTCAAAPEVVPGEKARCSEHAWWLSPEEAIVAKVHTQLREEQDVWAPAILKFALDPTAFSTAEGTTVTFPLTTENILKYALKCEDMLRIGNREATRVANVLKRAGYRRNMRGAGAVWLSPTSSKR